MDSQSIVTNGYISGTRIQIVETDPIILYGKMEGIMIKTYVGEEGKTFVVDAGMDISSASVQTIEVKKPDGTIVSWVAEKYSISGVFNYLKYVTVTGDLDQPGLYEIQAKVTVGDFTGYGKTDRFEVYSLFD